MSLPKIETPISTFVLPSTKREIKMRPMKVKEEKILLIAKESGEERDILDSIKQIVNNCLIDKGIDINQFPIFDLEYLFIKLRAISITNVVSVSYEDFEDNETYTFDINLDEVNVTFPENIKFEIKVGKTITIFLKYLDSSMYSSKIFNENNKESEFLQDIFINCIEKIQDGTNVFYPKDFSKKELIEFIEDLDTKSFRKFKEFIEKMPKIEHVVKYKNRQGKEKTFILNSLSDFFTLG